MKATLLDLFLELTEDVKSMKQHKYQRMRGYYQKHFGKDTFHQNYFNEMKFDFERIEQLEYFFNLLNEVDCSLLFAIAENLWTLKKEKQKSGQPIEYVQLWIPLVPAVRNLENCYLINLLNMEDMSHE
jgi:hypothetical protein